MLTRQRTTPTPAGFTLIELMVVVVIIGFLGLIAMPTLNRLTDMNRGDAGVRAVSTAVNAARILSQRSHRPDEGEIRNDPDQRFTAVSVEDVGTAVIFTQGGELRLVETHQQARDNDDDLLQYADIRPQQRPLYGFRDVAGRDYISVPRGTGIIGVFRVPANPVSSHFMPATTYGGQLRFIPPPFAIRFDRDGQLTTNDEFIYYDFNYDNDPANRPVYQLATASRWPGFDYNPNQHDPRRGANLLQTADGRDIYPHHEMPTVAAVILFDIEAFLADWADEGGWAVLDRDMSDYTQAQWEDPDPTDVTVLLHRWFDDHGTRVYFSPLTGVAMPRD